MYGAGIAVFAVWGYVIAHEWDGRVELNPRKLADTLGGTTEEVENAIKYLCSPDPYSRNKEYDGRRLLREGEFQYYAPSWKYYRTIQSEAERREYNRNAKRIEREKKRLKSGELTRATKTAAQVQAENDERETKYVRAAEAGDYRRCDEISGENLDGPEVEEEAKPVKVKVRKGILYDPGEILVPFEVRVVVYDPVVVRVREAMGGMIYVQEG